MLYLEPCPWIRATGPHTGDAEHLLVLQGPEGCHFTCATHHCTMRVEIVRQCTTPLGGINVLGAHLSVQELTICSMEELPGLWDFLGSGDQLQQEGLWTLGGQHGGSPWAMGLQVTCYLLWREWSCQLGQSFC